MANAQTRVTLMSLPTELLRIIVAEADAEDDKAACSLALVSRRLRALAQERLYSDISVTYVYSCFKQLARTLADRPDLRGAVQSMSLCGKYCKSGVNGRKARNVWLTANSLRAVLQLPNCKKLALDDISPEQLEEVFRPPLFNPAKLFRMTTLTLHIRPKSAPATSDVNCWNGLWRLPSLTDLRLTMWEATVASPTSTDVFGLVTRLTLVGDSLSEFRQPLFRNFPNLRILRIEEAENAAFIEQLLSTAPIKLASLSLAAVEPRIPMEQYPDRYRHLVELDLTPGFHIMRILPVLARSRIERLSFSNDCAVTVDALTSLVDGPYRMKQLKVLQLNFVHAPLGYELYDELAGNGDFDEPDGILDEVQSYRTMLRPVWPTGCTAADLARLVARGRDAGISLSGNAVDCLDWERDFDSQLEQCLVQIAMERGDLRVLERYYGREGAGDALARQRPQFAQLAEEAAARRKAAKDS